MLLVCCLFVACPFFLCCCLFVVACLFFFFVVACLLLVVLTSRLSCTHTHTHTCTLIQNCLSLLVNIVGTECSIAEQLKDLSARISALEDKLSVIKAGEKKVNKEVRGLMPMVHDELLNVVSQHGLSKVYNWSVDTSIANQELLGDQYEAVVSSLVRRSSEAQSRLLSNCRSILRGLPKAYEEAKGGPNRGFTREDVKLAILGLLMMKLDLAEIGKGLILGLI